MQLSWTVCVCVARNTHRGQLNAERQTHLIPDCTFVRLFVWLAGLEDRRCCCWWWKPVRKHVCQLHCCCSCSCCCYQQPRRQRLPSEMKQTKKMVSEYPESNGKCMLLHLVSFSCFHFIKTWSSLSLSLSLQWMDGYLASVLPSVRLSFREGGRNIISLHFIPHPKFYF